MNEQLKQCNRCLEIKPIEQFYKHPLVADGHLNQCIACRKEYTKIKGLKEHADIVKYEIAKRKSVPCSKCGIQYPPYVMEFFRVGKKLKISHVGSIKQLDRETKDAVIMCSNCHAIEVNPCIPYNPNPAKNYQLKYKSTHPCLDCGIQYPTGAMTYHHTDPQNKVGSISEMNCTLAEMIAEIEKCIVLCRNCHQEREWGPNGLSLKRVMAMEKQQPSDPSTFKWKTRLSKLVSAHRNNSL